MESLNLITTSELKAGRVFYFKNGNNKLELNHSAFTSAYWLYFNGKETMYYNFTDMKREASELITKYDLQQTLKP